MGKSSRDWDTLVPQIVEDLNNGRRLTAVAKELGLSSERIRQVMKSAGHPIPPQRHFPLGKRPARAILDFRNQQIINDRLTFGMPLEEIGRKHGISRERVRQILVQAGHESHTLDAHSAQSARGAVQVAQQRTVLVDAITANPAITRSDLALLTDARADHITDILGTRVWMLSEEHIIPPDAANVYSPLDTLVALRACARDFAINAISPAVYEQWRSKTLRDRERNVAGTYEGAVPGSRAIIRKHGDWHTAVTTAGYEPIASIRDNYVRITREEAEDAIIKFLHTIHTANPYGKGLASEYEVFAQTHPGYPSLGGMRLYWPWRDLRVAAVTRILRNPKLFELFTVGEFEQAIETEKLTNTDTATLHLALTGGETNPAPTTK